MTHPLGVGNTSHAHPYYDMHLWRCLTHQMLASGVGTHARVCEHVQKKAAEIVQAALRAKARTCMPCDGLLRSASCSNPNSPPKPSRDSTLDTLRVAILNLNPPTPSRSKIALSSPEAMRVDEMTRSALQRSTRDLWHMAQGAESDDMGC
eukprot:CAMPEP_0195614226 /NCGR_PEP_ID=MMETSP0815-20121206/11829_1 /TAXON_ID=97485 /ORGANISM="Prymnesium parvum, Strain Texoma1" /LENGTH=149 /DNA_ID=CAMNT_0040754467 /DNA_START=18 /DNA_END=464 /DNA_ORIENTATION=+